MCGTEKYPSPTFHHAGTLHVRSTLGPAQLRFCGWAVRAHARLAGVRAMVGRDPPFEGGRGHGLIGPKHPSADICFPSIGEGRVRFVRAHLCVRVLHTHTYSRGGKKGAYRDGSHEFWGST